MSGTNPLNESIQPQLLTIVENIGAAFLLESENRTIIQVNQSFCDLFQVPALPSQLVGTDCGNAAREAKALFVDPENFIVSTEALAKAKKKSEGEVLRMINGNTVMRSFCPVTLPNRENGYLWSYIDISNQIYLEELEIQLVINYFSSGLHKENTVEDILWGIVKNCISQLNFLDCVIYLLDEERQVLVQTAAWGPKSNGNKVVFNPIEVPLGKGIVGSVALTGQAEIVADTARDSRYIVDDDFRCSEIAVPILFEGKVIGVIDSEHPQPNFYSQKHLIILNTIASLSAIKIKQLQLQQHKQQELNQQKEFYEQILNGIPADIAVFDKSHRYLYVNPVAIRDPEVRKWIVNKRDEDYCELRKKPNSVFETRRSHFLKAEQARAQVSWEEKVIKPNGEEDWIIRTFHPMFDEKGSLALMIGYGINITERKKAEILRIDSEEKLSLIMNSSLDAIIAIDEAGAINEWNKRAEEIFGFQKPEVLGYKMADLIIPDRFKNTHALGFAQFLKTGDGPVLRKLTELVAKTKDEREIPVEIFIIPIQQDEQTLICAFIRDISERKIFERQKQQDSKRLKELFDYSPLMIFTHNLQFEILTANASTNDVLGFAPEVIVGRKLYEFAIAGIQDPAFVNYQRMLLEEEKLTGVVSVQHANGNLIYLLCNGYKLTSHGEEPYVIAFCQDITQMVLAERKLRKAKDLTDELASERERFWAETSHELRTPLTGILGISDLLENTVLSERQKTYVKALQQSSNNLLTIINNVLDLEKLKEKKLNLSTSSFSLRQQAELLQVSFAPLAERKGLHFTVDFRFPDESIVEGDRQKLFQILNNLLSNAMKFTRKGWIKLVIEPGQTDTAENTDIKWMQFEVSDSGVGIPPEYHSRIFQPFTQLCELPMPDESGSGLGLTICRSLAALMGGSLEVESEYGKGSAFTLRLPFKQPSDNRYRPAPPCQPAQVPAGKKILLVEDTKLNQLIVTEMLLNRDVHLDIASNGREAVEMATLQKYDLILMDIQMPIMDGIAALKAIKSQTQSPNAETPVISLSANAFEEDLRNYRESGFSDTLTKPFTQVMLINMLSKYLSAARFNQIEESDDIDEKAFTQIDLSYLKEAGKNKKEFVEMMLKQFCAQTMEDCSALDEHIETLNAIKLAKTMHRLKFSLEIIGANYARNWALLIESEARKQGNGQNDAFFLEVKSFRKGLKLLLMKIKQMLA